MNYIKLSAVLLFVIVGTSGQRYDPTWESLESRPLPPWFDQAKVGVFVHWGVFSVPSVLNEWFWYWWKLGNEELADFMHKNYKPGFTYQEFAPKFTAEFFNPDEWAELFQKSGAKYVVLTSKHHEGYTLWPSKYSFSWNSVEVGPHRDLVGDFAASVRNKTDLHFGLYYSLYEWFHPLYENDKSNNWETDEFVRFKSMPALYELVDAYQPEIVWSDGNWEAHEDYWKAKEFIAWLYNDSPVKDVVVTNDRWGSDTMCKHGGYWTCEDRYVPGELLPVKWENCFTIDKVIDGRSSWGYRRNHRLDDYMKPEEIIGIIAKSVAFGGNVLVNIAPTMEGTIPPIQEQRLLEMGEWLGLNGEAIYGSVPHTFQNDTVTEEVWYTSSGDRSNFYAIITEFPGESIELGSVAPRVGLQVELLGTSGNLNWVGRGNGIVVTFPTLERITSKWAWVLKFTS